MRFILILIATLWGLGALLAFALTARKSAEAKATAAYFGFWPAAAFLLYVSQPTPLWIAVPVVFGFIPWFLSGPHLWMVLYYPHSARPDEIAGIPKAYWAWGGLASVLLGALAEVLLRP
ncbi:hypothetical protein [Thiorhodovibrio frisius]|uniref:Uncharacterized protein n=1 Tax=Thiorhodovibrio frisius TaxID=631362 RepID=H8Z062_9GAMM|nr:hypothetical protein [Thiorhodovibrio frisius]EIC22270.1 hypothetical protein Thi970DRAFT_02523 [Thiorhodovibrio frisius]WPL24565.1 hypothetical protein Thiofri_04785 [Thiorhodovibrio frisius]